MSNTTRVLVVFENVPEHTDFFSIEASPEEVAKLAACHGFYINGDGWEDVPELNWLSPRLVEDDVQKIDPTQGPIDLTKFDTLVHTGFIL